MKCRKVSVLLENLFRGLLLAQARLFVSRNPGENGSHLSSLSKTSVSIFGGSFWAGSDTESSSNSLVSTLTSGCVNFSDLLTLSGISHVAILLSRSWVGEVGLWLLTEELITLESRWALGNASAASFSNLSFWAFWSNVSWGNGVTLGSSMNSLASLQSIVKLEIALLHVLSHAFGQRVVVEQSLLNVERSLNFDDLNSSLNIGFLSIWSVIHSLWLLLWFSNVEWSSLFINFSWGLTWGFSC